MTGVQTCALPIWDVDEEFENVMSDGDVAHEEGEEEEEEEEEEEVE